MRSGRFPLLLALLLIVVCVPGYCGSSNVYRELLMDLYRATDGPSWSGLCAQRCHGDGTFAAGCWGNTNVSYCKWEGVSCDGHKRLVGLILNNCALHGVTPMSFTELTRNMTVISIVGSLSAPHRFLSGLLKLHPDAPLSDLSLERNRLTGPLDQFVSYKKLQSLRVGHNMFTGGIPQDLLHANLSVLSLGNNLLNGPIVHLDFRNATALREIDISDNSLTGRLFTRVPQDGRGPVSFDISNNRLTGVIPASWHNGWTEYMEWVNLGDNQFSGRLANFFSPEQSVFYELQSLRVHNCHFNDSLSELSKSFKSANSPRSPLILLDLSRNNFTSMLTFDLFATNAAGNGFGRLVSVDISDNEGATTGSSVVPVYFDATEEFDSYGSFKCPRYLYNYMFFRVPPTYFSYKNCECLPGFVGSPPGCHGCDSAPYDILVCLGGSTALLHEVGMYPYTDPHGVLLGADECPRTRGESACNPHGNWTLGDPASERCSAGRVGRLCARCSSDSNYTLYSTGVGCRACAKEGTHWTLPVLITVLLIASVLFLFIRRGDVAVAIESMFLFVFILLGLGELWLIFPVFLLILVQIIITIQECRMKHMHEQTSGISLTGYAKLMLFYVQTSEAVNEEVSAVITSSLAPLTLNGFECSAPALYNTSPGSYSAVYLLLFRLLFPLGLMILFGLLVLAKDVLLRRSAWLRKRLKEPRRHTTWDGLWFVLLFVLYVAFFEECLLIFSVWGSDFARDGLQYVRLMPWMRSSFSDPLFQTLFILSFALGATVYLIAVPVICSVVIFKAPEKAPFLTENFVHKYRWYEMVWISRRIAVSLVAALLPAFDLNLGSFSMVTLLSGFIAFQYIIQPFRLKLENTLDIIGSLVIICTHIYMVTAEHINFANGGFIAILVFNGMYLICLTIAVLHPLLSQRDHTLTAELGGLLEEEDQHDHSF